MKIDIILPYKEIFSPENASAVSLTIRNSAEFSEFKKEIEVYGQYTEHSFKDIKFTGIKVNRLLHFGNNRSIIFSYINIINKNTKIKRIVEMHNRPYLFHTMFKQKIRHPITLHFHNDPREMKGSKSIKERLFIANHAASVYFVSEYIKNCFLEGLKKNYKNLFVLPNGIQRRILQKPKKKKQVLFIGRLVPEKGCHLFVNAIKDIVLEFPDWEFKIIGTPKAGQKQLKLDYAKDLIAKFTSLGNNVEYLGYIPNNEVEKMLYEASILVVPSIWQEPFALTALEGISNGVAVIASRVGGMVEMLENIGLLISEIDTIKLKESIKSLLLNPVLLNEYQNKSWNNYKYNQTDIVRKQDAFRKAIIDKVNTYS